jgi:hypothetical protein
VWGKRQGAEAMTLETVLGALLCLQPAAPHAARHAQIVWEVTRDPEEIAALLVTGTRESSWRTGCVQGILGAGTYGLGFPYGHWACGPLKVQALMSLQAYYDKGAAWDWGHAIQGYLGARSRRHPEVQRRIALFELTKERLDCACCI